jgi:hypothetical protein
VVAIVCRLFRPSEACEAAGDPVAPPVPLPTPAPRGLPPPEGKAELAAKQDNTIIAVGNSKAARPDPPAPKPALPAKYTGAVGGSAGASCEARCADGAYIKSWKLRTSAFVDSIQGLCSDGNWLKACGGDGGALSEVPGDSHAIPVRYGPSAECLRVRACARACASARARAPVCVCSCVCVCVFVQSGGDSRIYCCRSGNVVDKFNDKGGNGGAYSELNCGAGYKIAGYTTLVSSQVFPAAIRRRNGAPPTASVSSPPLCFLRSNSAP